jgi:hypothetical protein
MIKFCHISPTPHLNTFCKQQTHHLLLAHLAESDSDYTGWYRNHKTENTTYILDNSAFEMYKAGKEMYPSDKLIDLGRLTFADYVVMSDYPNEPGKKTIEAAESIAPQFRKNNLGTFFVPQSCIGDIEDYIATFAWAASSPLVDYIGVSILGVPNAYGVEKGNNLQRFLSRWKMMNTLADRGILKMAFENGKKIHFLGMVDGPNEIELVKDFFIDTWDSSAAIWTGLNGIAFDNTPSGLTNGKFELEVDFNHVSNDDSKLNIAMKNMEYINKLCRGH